MHIWGYRQLPYIGHLQLLPGLIEFTGPISAIGAILEGIDYTGLDHVMVFACGGLLKLNQVFAFRVYSYGTGQNA